MTYLNLPVEDITIKDRAESILDHLGISMEASFNMFLKAIVRENGIPLNLTVDAYDRAVLKILQEAEADEVDHANLHNVDEILSMMSKMIQGSSNV